MKKNLIPYAELHCISNFSFLRGASHPEDLVLHACDLHYAALALTDECSLAGIVRAHIAAKRCGLKLIIGSEFKIKEGPHLIALVENLKGYGNLCELITYARSKAVKGEYQIELRDFESLFGCLIIYLPAEKPDLEITNCLSKYFAQRCWIGVELFMGAQDRQRLKWLEELSQQSGLPLVASGDVHMHKPERKALQDTITAIRLGCTVHSAGFELHANAERYLRKWPTLTQIYPASLLKETLRIADLCNFSLDEIHYEYPKEVVAEGHTPTSYLRLLTEQGTKRRWPNGVSNKIQKQIEHELQLIGKLRYEAFFLTVYDVVKFAREQGILCQGRGSAANSVVCYCLGITEVNPDEMDMLFERFISQERNEPPDIDVDFEHERREEVIQYIYGKYGRERAALAATVITYRAKSAIRDIGKALGLSLAQVDCLAKSMAWWDKREIPEERLREAGVDPQSPLIKHLVSLTSQLLGFPRHLSQHPGGFVISQTQLSRLVPIENATMPDRTVLQWDKDDLDALGLLKVDVLGLGMLTTIRRALALLSQYPDKPTKMQEIPHGDKKTYEMISRADTIGVFQIESRAQMTMLPRLKPKNYYDLVIEVALVRPGPIQGGMIHPYLRRREGLEEVTYPSPDVEHVLKRTLGVPVFQEQVMQLAIVAAGFKPGEADQLRRAIGGWRDRIDLETFRIKLIRGMEEKGYSSEFAQRLYSQIKGFGNYGFPESHSASFALLAYLTAWLKCHEPAAFTCALLNSQPVGFYAPAQLIRDAREHGVEVKPVDVQVSDWDCSLENTADGAFAIRLGLRMAKGVQKTAMQRLVAARKLNSFKDAQDLLQRAQLNRQDLESLAAAGALHTLSGHRHNALWEVLGTEKRSALLSNAVITECHANLKSPTEGENIVLDYSQLGFTLGRHPLSLLRNKFTQIRALTAQQLDQLEQNRIALAVGLVTCRQRPATSSGVTFLTLEDETGMFNVVVWFKLGERHRRELTQGRLLGVVGKVERQGKVMHFIARRLIDYSHLLGNLVTTSRDFM